MLSHVLHSPHLTDKFNVLRRVEGIDAYGRSKLTITRYKPVFGVVAAIDPSDVRRKPDEETPSKTITVITRFNLQSATRKTQPDIVEWHGDRFIVINSQDYSRWARGFMICTCDLNDFNVREQDVVEVPG